MKNSWILLCALVLICGFLPVHSQSLNVIAKGTKDNNPKGYIEYLPRGYQEENGKKYPILYWLHGLENKGMGTEKDLQKILDSQICEWLKTHNVDFIVLAPQDFNGYWSGTPTRIRAFVEWATEEYKSSIDLGQQHMAGLSGGGYGLRDFIIENSAAYKAFATFTAMSTNLNTANDYARRIVDNDQYIWIHQGSLDKVPNAITSVVNFHRRVLELDSTRSRLTAYKNLGHSAWEMVYSGEGMKTPQAEGSISGTPYYVWTPNDLDGNWFNWMKACGKSMTNAVTPTAIELSNASVDENKPPSWIGSLNANGQKPVAFRLAHGAADNTLFNIEGNELMTASTFDFEKKSRYSVSVEAYCKSGSVVKTFVITVRDVAEPQLDSADNDRKDKKK